MSLGWGEACGDCGKLSTPSGEAGVNDYCLPITSSKESFQSNAVSKCRASMCFVMTWISMISQIHHKWHYFYVYKTFFYSLWEAFPGKSCCWQMDPQYQDQTGYSSCFEVTLCRHDESFVWLLVWCVAVKQMLFQSHVAFTNQQNVSDVGLQQRYVSRQAASGLIQLESDFPRNVLTLCMREFKSLSSFSSAGLEPEPETS